MSTFERLIHFESDEHESMSFYADIGIEGQLPEPGTKLQAYRSMEELLGGKAEQKTVSVKRLLAPLPRDDVPIYCVGLNFRSHAKEADLPIPSYPPLWTKPVTSISHPDEDIPINDFCAKSLLDYEGEMVFVTSKKCRDVSPSEAKGYILGYTVGNDLSCRLFQLPKNSGGQFFFAKAFDKFAPIGPTLLSPECFAKDKKHRLVTRVNGEVRQDIDLQGDLIFRPEIILSHMSQGTTIPAGTAVMTGTGAGVGAFMKPKTFLQNGDVIEVELGKIGILRNKMHFEVKLLTKIIVFVQMIIVRFLTRW